MKSLAFLVLLALLMLCRMIHAQTITLNEFLGSVSQTHPVFAKEDLTPQIEMKAQERFLGAQDWIISASPYYTYQEPIATSTFAADRVYAIGAEVSAQRTYWRTGGRLTMSWSSDLIDQKVPDIVMPFSTFNMGLPDLVIPTGPSKLYQHRLYLMYSQPLLQNFKGKLDRLSYELSQYNIDFSEIEALENQEGFLLDIGTRFLDWVLLSEQTRIANERLHLAEEQLEQTTRMRRSNLVDRVDVLRAEDAVRLTKQGIVLLEAQWKSKQAELAVLAQSDDLYAMSPDFDLYSLTTVPAPDEAAVRLREESRILDALAIRQQQLSHVLDGASESSRPQLFLNVGFGLQNGDDELAASLEIDKPDATVSLGFTYPLGTTTARSDIAKTNLEILQLQREIDNVALDLEASLRNLLIQIEELKKVLVLNQQHIESAGAKTNEEQRLYNQGRGQLTFVIQSRDSEEEAKLTYAQNAASYHRLILVYTALMDELLPAPGSVE
jgi:outer membrane protein TolC